MVLDLRLRDALSVAVFLVAAVASALPAQADQFDDDDAHPAEPALEWLAERGVVDGCNPPVHDEVCPDQPLSRVQAAKMLVGLARREGVLEQERPGEVDHFRDDDSVWGGTAEPYVDHLADEHIIHGCDPPTNRSFCPKDLLEKGEIVKMVVRTFDLDAPDDYPSPWTDTQGQFFHESARVAAFHDLVDYSAGHFDGFDVVTRGEFARILVRVFEPDLCADDPFPAARVAELESDHPGVSFTAYAHDLETGCAYWMNPESRQETASVLKVMVMGGTLLEAQDEGRSVSSGEMALLRPMITESANPPVRELWRMFGAAPWFRQQAERFGLDQTDPVGDYGGAWGTTTTSAYDQGALLRQVLLGEEGLIEARYRSVAQELMTSVVPSQTWGVTEGMPDGWTAAQKNGFAGLTANSVGIVYDEEMDPRYVSVVLTYGWPGWQDGVPSVNAVAGWVAEELAE